MTKQNKEQSELSAKTFGCVRFVYNKMLVERKDKKHRIVRKLRSKAHHMELALDIAKDSSTNEKRVLEHLNNFLMSVADDVEEL